MSNFGPVFVTVTSFGLCLLGTLVHALPLTEKVAITANRCRYDKQCAIYWQVLLERAEALQGEEDLPVAMEMHRLVDLVRLQLGRPETQPEGMMVQMLELADVPLMERWRLYRCVCSAKSVAAFFDGVESRFTL